MFDYLFEEELMKKMSFCFIAFLLIELVAGCSIFDSDIDIVKKYITPGNDINIEKSIAMLAGVTGSVEWKSFQSDEYKNNPDIGVVEVVVLAPKNPTYKHALFQYLVNRKTKEVNVSYIEFNHKPHSLLESIAPGTIMPMESAMPR